MQILTTSHLNFKKAGDISLIHKVTIFSLQFCEHQKRDWGTHICCAKLERESKKTPEVRWHGFYSFKTSPFTAAGVRVRKQTLEEDFYLKTAHIYLYLLSDCSTAL